MFSLSAEAGTNSNLGLGIRRLVVGLLQPGFARYWRLHGLNKRPPSPPAAAAAPEPNSRSVVMASDYQLGRKSHFQRLAIAAAAAEMPRREWPNAIADAIYGFEGSIYYADGRKFEPTDTEVDDTFDDPEFRWISYFLTFAEVEPRQRPQRRVLARLRLIDLYFRIKYPERARLIAE